METKRKRCERWNGKKPETEGGKKKGYLLSELTK